MNIAQALTITNVVIIVGLGFRYLESKTEKERSDIGYALAGVALILAAGLIGQTISGILETQYMTPRVSWQSFNRDIWILIAISDAAAFFSLYRRSYIRI